MTEYLPGREVDVYGDGPTVLMWHGRTTDDRESLADLAVEVARRGRRVVVPGYDPSADDLGRADLLASLAFARETADHDPDWITLVGWSLGGIAAASVTRHQRDLGVGVLRTVCVAAAPFPRLDPITQRMLGPATSPEGDETDLVFVHSSHDDLMTLHEAEETAAQWREVGWSVDLVELDADHFSIVTDHFVEVADTVVR